MSLAVIFSVCGAFVTRPHYDCTTMQQYYEVSNNNYAPTGILGIDYTCSQGSGTCTYYTTNGGITYTPCMSGVYDPCQGCIVKKPSVKTH